MTVTTIALSDEQLARYRDEGWVALGRILDDDEVAELRDEERRCRPSVGYGAKEDSSLLVSVQLAHRSEPVRRLATTGRHLGAVTQILGPDVCLTHNQFLNKLPDTGGVHNDIPMHQDNGYGRLDPPDDVTVWVALVDTTPDNGCLHVVPGSHRGGLLEHDRAAVNPALREAAGGEDAVAVPMVAGEAIAFTGMTLHGSGQNRTDAERPAFYLRYCTPWVRMMSEGGRPVLDDAHSWMVAGSADGSVPG